MNLKLEEKIDNIKKLSIEELCEKFDCKPKEICIGDYIARNTNHKVCPYKVILGFANFEDSNVESLGKLEVVYGKKLEDYYDKLPDIHYQAIYLGLNLKNSKITNFGKVKKIYGSVSLNRNITSMGSVEYLGSNLYLNNSNIVDLGNITHIDGTLNIEDDSTECKLESLGKLKKVRRLCVCSNCLHDLGDLEEAREIKVSIKCNKRVKALFEKNMIISGTKYIRKGCNFIK